MVGIRAGKLTNTNTMMVTRRSPVLDVFSAVFKLWDDSPTDVSSGLKWNQSNDFFTDRIL